MFQSSFPKLPHVRIYFLTIIFTWLYTANKGEVKHADMLMVHIQNVHSVKKETEDYSYAQSVHTHASMVTV